MEYSTFFLKSYGCQMNIYDSEKIISILENKGLKKNQDVESIVENTSEDSETSFSQEAIQTHDTEQENSADLKEFGVDLEEPDLFNTDNQTSNSEDLLGSVENDDEEDDLEIPAFLRRQKN